MATSESTVLATLTLEKESTEEKSEVESHEITNDLAKSISVKKPSEAIVANSVSIDVFAEELNESKNGHSLPSQICQTTEKRASENVFVKYFRRTMKGKTRSQIVILCIFPFVEFFAATVISIQGPFFPGVAQSKGATPTESGLVFGTFELIVFIMAPIFGAKMGVWNPNRIFNYGIFTTSLSCAVFGFVHFIEDRTTFVTISMLIRSIEAIGDAAFVVASFSIIAIEFPESVATTFALMETCYGLGMVSGGIAGGIFFKIGGFTLPFVAMGVLLFISAIATYIFITRESPTPDPDKIITSASYNMFKMLRIPAIALTAYATFAAATGIGFLNNNLELHLHQFGLEAWEVGCIFMLNGGVYALTAPFWGRLCDKTSQPKIYLLIGSALTILGFIFVGPLPFFPDWKPTILLACIGLVIFGLGLGSTLVSAFILFLQDAISNGHPDDVTTHGLVSGLWVSMTAFAFFVGATAGGILDTFVGFRWGTMFIIIEQIILIGLLSWYLYNQHKHPSSPTSSEKQDDNLDDIVITYAIKFNTPKPRKNKVKAIKPNEELEETKPDSKIAGERASCSQNADINKQKEPEALALANKGLENPNYVEDP